MHTLFLFRFWAKALGSGRGYLLKHCIASTNNLMLTFFQGILLTLSYVALRVTARTNCMDVKVDRNV